MKRMCRKWICIFLSVIMLCVPLSISATAEERAVYVLSPETGLTETNVAIQEEDLFIPAEVAEYIAEFFVADMFETGQTVWQTEPSVLNVVPMYDETGEKITSYSIELSSGYVVVSAYIDVPNIILEWADVAEPVYASFGTVSANAKVVYTGALKYFLDKGETKLESIDGQKVSRADILTPLKEVKSLNHVTADTLECIVTSKTMNGAPTVGLKGNVGDTNFWAGFITDPFEYAKNVYFGNWIASEYANNWENYATFVNEDDLPGHYRVCGPVAIINMIKMYGGKYGNSSMRNANIESLFLSLRQLSFNSGKDYYIDNYIGGTDPAKAGEFITQAFKQLYNINVSLYGRAYATYSNIKNNLSSSNKLLYLDLESAPDYHPYTNHVVLGYAYTRLKRTSDGDYKSFLKICDGLNTSARYLDIGVIQNYRFWAVSF